MDLVKLTSFIVFTHHIFIFSDSRIFIWMFDRAHALHARLNPSERFLRFDHLIVSHMKSRVWPAIDRGQMSEYL